MAPDRAGSVSYIHTVLPWLGEEEGISRSLWGWELYSGLGTRGQQSPICGRCAQHAALGQTWCWERRNPCRFGPFQLRTCVLRSGSELCWALSGCVATRTSQIPGPNSQDPFQASPRHGGRAACRRPAWDAVLKARARLPPVLRPFVLYGARERGAWDGAGGGVSGRALSLPHHGAPGGRPSPLRPSAPPAQGVDLVPGGAPQGSPPPPQSFSAATGVLARARPVSVFESRRRGGGRAGGQGESGSSNPPLAARGEKGEGGGCGRTDPRHQLSPPEKGTRLRGQ